MQSQVNFIKFVWLISNLFIVIPLFSKSGDFQNRLVNKNNMVLSVGYGTPSALRMYIRREEADKDLKVEGFGPFTVKFEFSPIKKITIGFNGIFNTSDVHWLQNANDAYGISQPYRHGVIVKERGIALRLNYYFKQTNTFNFYTGVGAGLGYINAETYTRAPKEKLYINHTFPTPYHFEGTIGTRYFINDHLGLFSEIGVGQSWLIYEYYFVPAAFVQMGLSVKL